MSTQTKPYQPLAERMRPQSLGEVVQTAMGHSGFVVMSLAFFVCGLQLVFLTTHLPNYLDICGLDPSLGATALATIGFFNVVGSYACGWLGGRYPKQVLLGAIYIIRSVTIAVYFMNVDVAGSAKRFSPDGSVIWPLVRPRMRLSTGRPRPHGQGSPTSAKSPIS